jgi:hypothetical protein
VIDISQTLELVRSTYSPGLFFHLMCVDKSSHAFGNDIFVKKIQHVFSL